MALLVQNVLARSLAAKAGIISGDVIVSINGHSIQDFLDLQYYSSDIELSFELQDESGSPKTIAITRDHNRALGIEPEAYRCRFCQNRCVFCFIDQMPPRLRESLYVKDDDYLYSFVFGNYITLTNLRSEDIQRIINQHISPLYISVHTTDSGLRKQMMRYRQDIEVLNLLKRFSKAGISFHAQIVIVPGMNDGETLKESIRTLLHPKLKTLSIGLVPVGLTKYRANLPIIEGFNKQRAIEVLDLAQSIATETKENRIYCADELFVLANIPIPPEDYYNGYPQLENGIGMLRLMMENFGHKKRAFLKELRKKERSILFVTGKSAASYIMDLSAYLNSRLEGISTRVQVIENQFMGTNISVSGLLTFEDITEQIEVLDDEAVALPNNVFNHDGITIDGFTQLELKQKLQRELLVIDHLFEDWDWI